MYVHT